MRRRGFLFCLALVVLGSAALVGLAVLDGEIRAAGHARAVRQLKRERRIRTVSTLGSPRLSVREILALEDRRTRDHAILKLDLGAPTAVNGDGEVYVRSIPLSSRPGEKRQLDIVVEVRGDGGGNQRWILREDGIAVDSGSSAFDLLR